MRYLPFLRPCELPLRLRVFGVCGALGTAFAFARSPAPPATIQGLAAALASAAHAVVAPSDVRWEPSEGAFADLAVGRWVLFLGSEAPSGPRDVYRARVRVTPEGNPLSVAETYDLTQTPLGDDHTLVVSGRHAAFATYAYGQEQSVSVLDLAGEGRLQPEDPFADRVTRWLSNVQQTGRGDGIGRMDVTLDPPARAVGLAVDDQALRIDCADGTGSRRQARLDLTRGELTPSTSGLHAEAVRHLPKRFILWAVDTVRAVPWIGPAPVAWLEEQVFAVRDTFRQIAFRFSAEGSAPALADSPATARPDPASSLATPQTEGADDAWPPRDIPSIWQRPEPGEGVWKDPHLPWLRRNLDSSAQLRSGTLSAPPAFYRTFVRPDEDRPYVQVLLVAMDMRQLDLDMEAGTEDPKPLTGNHGPGRIPHDPATLSRVVAAFNGAFKTEHGNYGMMVHKHVLLPPQPNAATVAVLSDARVGFGTWGSSTEIGPENVAVGGDIVSFRQNLDPLVDGGEINPMGRALWGYTLPGSGMQTVRSGLCVTGAGQLVYGWGDDVSGPALGKALKMAGCTYALHLDMNPHHTGFLFATVNDARGKSFHSEVLTPLMEMSPDRYLEYSPKDFFYVMLHDPTPPALGEGAAAWQPDWGAQPAPAWAPSIWAARVDRPEGSVEVLDLEPGRVRFRLRAGTREPDPRTGARPAFELSPEDARGVVLAVGLGLSAENHPRGLATEGRLVHPVQGSGRGTGLLVVRADGSLALLRPEELAAVDARVDLAELPLVLDDGAEIGGGGGGFGNVARAALGVTPAGRVLVARGTFASYEPLVDTLRREGCARAVVLDRGGQSVPFLHRAGTAAAPQTHYEATVLYVVAAPMRPRAFRFEARSPLAHAGVTPRAPGRSP